MLIRSPDLPRWHAPATTAYADEAELQRLITDSPSLVPGVQDDAVAVAREVGVPGVGAADVVVVDSAGGITAVECKLAANAEIRRWVIGQVFSYAAGLWQLSYEDLERAFAARGEQLAASFRDVPSWGATEFREVVEANLQRGAFRLVIAVDQITDELKRTILYINRHTAAELQLLALELRLAADSGVEILLPEVYGEESATEPTARRPKSDEAGLIRGINETHTSDCADRLIRLFAALRDAAARPSWGTGARSSVTMWLGEGSEYPVSVSLYSGEGASGGVAVNFDFVRDKRCPEEMSRLAALVREVPGVAPYLEGLEDRNWGMHRIMETSRVLGSETALEAFKRAVFEAAVPPSR